MSYNILDIYNSILTLVPYKVSSTGEISYESDNKDSDIVKPVLLNNKRLVLPTPNQLQNPDWTNREAFHILDEDVISGESEMLSMFRKDALYKLNLKAYIALIYMLGIMNTPKKHEQLIDCEELLLATKDIDDKFLTFVNSVLDAMIENQCIDVVHIYLKKQAKIKDKSYLRGSIVSSPLLKELEKQSPYGINCRVKDKAMLTSAVKFLFPLIETENYNVGSVSRVAPYVDCLINTLGLLYSDFNNCVDKFTNTFDADNTRESHLQDLSFSEYFKNIDDLQTCIRMIPNLKVPQAPTNVSNNYNKPQLINNVPSQQLQQPNYNNQQIPQQFNMQPDLSNNQFRSKNDPTKYDPSVLSVEPNRGMNFQLINRQVPISTMSPNDYQMAQTIAQTVGAQINGYQQPQQQNTQWTNPLIQPVTNGWPQPPIIR